MCLCVSLCITRFYSAVLLRYVSLYVRGCVGVPLQHFTDRLSLSLKADESYILLQPIVTRALVGGGGALGGLALHGQRPRAMVIVPERRRPFERGHRRGETSERPFSTVATPFDVPIHRSSLPVVARVVRNRLHQVVACSVRLALWSLVARVVRSNLRVA